MALIATHRCNNIVRRALFLLFLQHKAQACYVLWTPLTYKKSIHELWDSLWSWCNLESCFVLHIFGYNFLFFIFMNIFGYNFTHNGWFVRYCICPLFYVGCFSEAKTHNKHHICITFNLGMFVVLQLLLPLSYELLCQFVNFLIKATITSSNTQI